MPSLPNFGSVTTAAITILVDNRADLLLKSSETVKYFQDKPLLAEHGFAALLDLNHGEHRLLWDAGVSPVALIENLQRMGIDPKSIHAIALSHGHFDHTTAVSPLLRLMDLYPQEREWAAGTPPQEMQAWSEVEGLLLILHPAAQRERWGVSEDGRMFGPSQPPPVREWQALGARLILSEAPYCLAPGCWTTGYVPRRSFETAGRNPGKRLYRQGLEFIPDDMEDDQAIVIHLQGKGLIVLSGCAHAGILNTARYAQEISGVGQIHAILGGFHLAPASPQDLQRTVEEIQALQPQVVAPCHCTGLTAEAAFARHIPEQFVESVVGVTFEF
jgi:7,8-dihydropterin-6-yl-methyl-4-(beta-D-ribofuranosyl)aminobenzene 5'-phosphate synthase